MSALLPRRQPQPQAAPQPASPARPVAAVPAAGPAKAPVVAHHQGANALVARAQAVLAARAAQATGHRAPPVQVSSPSHVAADARLTGLIDLTERLATLIEAENDKIRKGKAREIAKDMAEKERLAKAYEEELKAVRADASTLKAASDELKAKARKATERFRHASELHQIMVHAVQSVAEGIVKRVREFALNREQPVTHYGRNGAVMRMPVAGLGAVGALPVAIHQLV
ncbi:MAG: hypothetical protein FJX47_05075 [Alphaproteobacteria bacterium]|nr:hypothetical protein [Alphaproteobacteria bacterium]